jgi:predicted O-linked N-acetylglucosamine transferase (SPINDLY family)
MSGADPELAAAVEEVFGLIERQAFAAAAEAAEQALARWPGSVDLWNLAGAARLMAGDPAGGARATARALELDPASADARRNHAVAAEALRQRVQAALSRLGEVENEGLQLDEAVHALSAADDAGVLAPETVGPALAVFLRAGAAEAAARRRPFTPTGRAFAARGDHRSLLHQLPRVQGDADRRELLAQHRAWGRKVEAEAAAAPVRPAPRGPRARLRLGLLSSDLRLHVVTAFADPLIEHAPQNGVEIYAYSAQPGAPDGAQRHIAGRVAAFRHLPGADAAALAQAVAADAPDVLVEIGGSTNANRLEAMAQRLAPLQASWLGYPHSTGLSTIDAFLLDPRLVPTGPGLILERPLVLPRSFIALSPGYFRDEPQPRAEPPQDRKGYVTFGTANSTYKYSPAALSAWARVLAAVPGSRFLFVRPEGGSAVFRANMAEHFARQGVSADRLEFAAVRGGHLPWYGEIDISLDSFPLTGGTTTCEALWMGVPVVSLAGPAVYERLSHSILHSAGLADLSVGTVDAFVARAVALAADREARLAWRADCRARIKASPLWDMPGFAAEFCAAVRAGL